MIQRHFRSLLPLVAFTTFAVACRPSEQADAAAFRGVYIAPALEKPDIVLTDFDGKPFNLRLQTADKVTLVFFGYTHCPDVCPLHAANIAAVLKQMPFEEREAIRFVFVTTDPERDTPERLKQWLGNFDPSFIGLTGDSAAIAAVQAGLAMAPSRREVANGDSANYLVGHAAQVVAFSRDGLARLEYPFGIRQEDWAKDLPRLARGEVPPMPKPVDGTKAGAIDLAPTTAAPAGPPIQLVGAFMPQPAATTEAALYVILTNNATKPDTLVSVWSPSAQQSAIHQTAAAQGGMATMSMVEKLVIPPSAALSLEPGATHIMFTGLQERPNVGDSFPVRLRFANAGEVVLAAAVVAYSDLERHLADAKRGAGVR